MADEEQNGPGPALSPDIQGEQPAQSATQQPPNDSPKKLFDLVSDKYDLGDYDTYREKIKNPKSRKALYDLLSHDYDLGTPDEYERKMTGSSGPSNQLSHTSVSDLRHLQEQSNQDQDINIMGSDVKESDVDPEAANKKSLLQDQTDKQSLDVAGQYGFKSPDDLHKVMKDFPYENDPGKLKIYADQMAEDPVAYSRFRAADENMNMLFSAAPKGMKSSVTHEYNSLQDYDPSDLAGLEGNIARQKEIINTYLTGDERQKALDNLAVNKSSAFNSTNPAIWESLEADDKIQTAATVDTDQYAGLKTLQQFDPAKYKLYYGILTNADMKDASPDEKLGMEKIQKELLDIGRRNKINYLSEQQHQLDSQYKNAQTDEEKTAISNKFIANKNEIEKAVEADQNEAGRFPYMKDLEFEKQTRELIGSGELNPATVLMNRFGRGASSAIGAVQDAATELFGSDQDVANNRVGSIGEQETENARTYQPSLAKNESPITYQFDKGLKEQADRIKSYRNLSDDQKYEHIYKLVKNNSDQVHTITNSEFGKTANFFSKATMYKSAGMIGDVIGIAAQQGLLKAVGAPKLIAAATPMFLTTEHDFYKEALDKGISNPAQYATTHAAIMMAAGAINPDLDIVKRSLGLKSELGKTLAGVSEKTWNDVLAANKPVLSKIKNSLSSVAKEAGKMGAVYGAGTSIANDLANKGLFNQQISGEEIVNHAVSATRDILSSSVPLLGLNAVMNFKNVSPQEKARLWDMGDNVKLNSEKIDHLVESGQISSEVGEQRKQFIKNVGNLIEKVPAENAKGDLLTDQQKANYLYRMVIKDKIGKLKGDLPEVEKARLEGQNKLLDMENGEALRPGSAEKAVASELSDLKFKEGQILMKGFEGKGKELMDYIRDQVLGRTSDGKISETGPAKDAVESLKKQGIPEHLIEGAIRFMPEDDRRHTSEMHTENKTEPTGKVKDWLRTPEIEKEPVTKRIQTTESPLPEGETPVTLSGMTEEERQQAISDRRGNTEMSDGQKWENSIHERIKNLENLKPSEKAETIRQIRQEVLKRNAQEGAGKYKFDGYNLRKLRTIQSGPNKGVSRFKKVHPVYLETGNTSIHDQGVVLRDRSPELQKNFEALSDVAEHLEVPDASNNRSMSKEQIKAAIDDIHDGIPSVQAQNVLDVMEKGVKENAFPVREMPGHGLTFNELTGTESEVTGEPFDQSNIEKWLDDESKLTPEQEEVLQDNFENLLHEYETPDEGSISEIKSGGEKGNVGEAESNAGNQTETKGSQGNAETQGSVKVYRAGGDGQHFSMDKVYPQEGGFKGDVKEFTLPPDTKLLDLKDNDFQGLLDLATAEEKKILQKSQAKNSAEAAEQNEIKDRILKRNGYDGYTINEAGENGKTHETIYLSKEKAPTENTGSSVSGQENQQENKGTPKLTVVPEKELPPTVPPTTQVPADPGHQSGTRISKDGIFEQYGVQFEKTKVGWNKVTQDAVAGIIAEAERKGISTAEQAEAVVNQLDKDIDSGKLSVDENKIVTAALHLMNLDEAVDNVNSRIADTQLDIMNRAADLAILQEKRITAMRVLDAMGSKSGRNLGLYAGFFSKDPDGGVSATRNTISGMLGYQMPETLEELEKSTSISDRDKAKIRPYIERLNQIKADYDAAIKLAKEGKAASPKSQAKSSKFATKLRDAAKGVRENKAYLDKILGGNIKGVKKQGFSVDVHEMVAKALEYIADKIDGGYDIKKAIEEAADLHHGKSDRDDFKGVLDMVMKQNPELRDLAKGEKFDIEQDQIDATMERQRRKTLGELKALAQTVETNASPAWRTMIDYRRSFLIGGIKTLARVAESGVSKLTVDPIVDLTAGNIISFLPGMKKGAVSIGDVAKGFHGLIEFSSDEAALKFADERLQDFKDAAADLEKDPENTELQNNYMKAELANAQADIYRSIHGNFLADSKEIAKHGSTAFDQSMGGYAQVDPKVLKGTEKVLFYLNTLTRLHGVEKNPSARRALFQDYNSNLKKMQAEGTPLSVSARMRALDMAYIEFNSGKYQNKSWLSKKINAAKYAGYKKGARAEDRILSAGLNVALPVAKIAINIVKSGVDYSTGGIEGWARYAVKVREGMKNMTHEQKAEYKTVWGKLDAAAKQMPEEQRRYIAKVMARGLFGAGLYALAAYGVKSGSIRYGGEYDKDHAAKRRYKKSDGTWSEPNDLDYGQWEIAGHKFGKFGSSVMNHIPEFLPIAMYVNTHQVYDYEHNYEGASGDRVKQDAGESMYRAALSDINEIYERLPFDNLLHPINMITNLIQIPLAKEISDVFVSHPEQRKPKGLVQHIEKNIGAQALIPRKKPEE